MTMVMRSTRLRGSAARGRFEFLSASTVNMCIAMSCIQFVFPSPSQAQGGSAVGANFRAVHRPETVGDPVFDELLPGGLGVPDTMGSVGPEHVMVFINGRYEIYAKSGLPTNGTDALPVSGAAGGLHDFWNLIVDGVSLTDASYTAFDPRIAYDPSVQRWYAIAGETTIAPTGGPQLGPDILFARSRSADPTAGWNGLRIGSLDSPFLVDMPTLGFDREFVYLSLNAWNAPNAVIAVPKVDVLQEVLTADNRSQFQLTLNTPNLASYVTEAFDNLGPDSQPFHIWNANPLAAEDDTKLIQFNRISKQGPVLSLIADDPPETIQFTSDPAPGFSGRQPDAENHLSAQGDLMSGVVRIGGSYWGAVARKLANDGVVHWFQIDAATATLQDSGIISLANRDLIYPAVAVNPRGDVVIGFTATGPNEYPSAYAAVRTSGASNFAAPMLLRAGTASYDDGVNDPGSRWGDYSATVFDPADPNIFWTFQEWASGPSEWSVQASEIIVFSEDEFYWRDTTTGSFTDASHWLGFKGAAGANDHAIFSRPGAPYGTYMNSDHTNRRLSVRQGDAGIGFLSVANGRTYTVTDGISVAEYQGAAKLTLYSGLFTNSVKTDQVFLGSRGDLALWDDNIKLRKISSADLPDMQIELDRNSESGQLHFNSNQSIQLPNIEFVFVEGYDPQLGDEFTVLTNTGTGTLEGFTQDVTRLLGDRYIKVDGEPVIVGPADFDITMPLQTGQGQQLKSTSSYELRAGLRKFIDESGDFVLKLRVSYIADFDLDWDVDGLDLGVFSSMYNMEEVVNCIADFDGDGDVDGLDLGAFSGQFGSVYSPGGGGGGVPEPTNIMLFGLVMVGLIGLRRRG